MDSGEALPSTETGQFGTSADPGAGAAAISSIPDRASLSCFQRADWLSFSVTTALVLAVYVFTLPPELTLEYSGVLATGANYAGIPAVPGYPLWTLYAWAFTKLVPFSNVAWRISFSSAVAGALACGVIALSVSRAGALILDGMSDFRRLAPRQEALLRVVSGLVAGAIFGFHRTFWGLAIIVESTALAVVLFATSLCLLLCWWYDDNARNRYLYAAAFAFGLTLAVELQFAAALVGLPFLILLRRPSLGRDLFFAIASLLWTAFLLTGLGYFPALFDNLPLARYYRWIAIVFTLVAVGMTIITRRLLTCSLATFATGVALVLPLSIYLYLPVASMTNPPMNWGYPRTVEGFFHAISRGQYERIYPTPEFGRFLSQFGIYAAETVRRVGLFQLFPVVLPFLFLNRMDLRARGWILGLTATFLSLSCLTVALLNPGTDLGSRQLFAVFYIPSHLILALWTGIGLCLLGTILSRDRNDPSRGAGHEEE